MAKQQSLHRVKMYDPSTYRSVEQKVMGALEPVGKDLVDFGGTLIKSLYGIVFAPLRFPTFIRRCANEQALMSKIHREEATEPISWGITIGVIAGAAADIGGFVYTLEQAGNGNYIPLAVWGGTNLGFGIYELGRLKTSKKEHLGLQKYKEWQQKKEEEKEAKTKTQKGKGRRA